MIAAFRYCWWWDEARLQQQRDFIECLRRSGIKAVAFQFHDDPGPDIEGVEVLRVLRRRRVEGYAANPIVPEIFDRASELDNRFCFLCSDLLLRKDWAEPLLSLDSAGIGRRDITDIGFEDWWNGKARFQVTGNGGGGYVGFSFDSKWWQAHRHLFPDYINASPIDTDYDAICARHCPGYRRLRLADHRPHAKAWHHGDADHLYNVAMGRPASLC